MKKYECPDCGQEFTSGGGLKYHVENNVCKKGDAIPKKGVGFNEAISGILSKIDQAGFVPLKPIKPPKIIKGGGDEEQVVLKLSDWQLGHKTRTFNMEVARQRVEKCIQAAVKIVEIHRQAYPIRRINVFLEGDFIHNEKVGQTVDLDELEATLMTQVYGGAVPMLIWAISELAKYFEEVYVYPVRGNHGKGEKYNSQQANWDDVVYHTLAVKFSENPRVRIFLTDEYYQIVDIVGTRFLIVHGDQVRGGSYGIPLYALLARMLRWATSFEEDWDILSVAHWHCFSHLEQNGQELIVNGTLVSDDEFVRRTYGWNSSTLQVMFGVHPRKGITWEYRIKLG